jgi:hypothetical protein
MVKNAKKYYFLVGILELKMAVLRSFLRKKATIF